MTPRIPALPYRKLAKVLRKQGFRPVRQRGSHVRWEHGDGRWTIVPHHAGEDLDAALVKAILEEAGLDPDIVRR